MKKILLILSLFFVTDLFLFAQVDEQTQRYRNDNYGNRSFRKKGIMDGNLIRTNFRNDGQVGAWQEYPTGEWPKGSGHNYIDGCTPIVTSKVIAPGNGQEIHPAQTSYREEVDFDPATNLPWVMEPVPGYALSNSESPAISTNSETWPEAWPIALDLTPEWNGYWYGYFGRGVQNADFETFYVMDDSKDREFTRAPYYYFPIADDEERGGLGLRVEVRGFQWSHVLAEDIIFWHYDIVNISDFDYDSTLFGFYCDTGVGGDDDNGDDNASFDTKLDIAYAYDNDGVTPTGWNTGYVGYAYLESPGNAFNGIDDDEDGMIDERRDDNKDNDGDWVPYTDLNANGKWDPEENEPLNSDVGRDGVGPFDPQYNGPDEGEGDGIPTHGEPNFDETDKDESDQIGLTSLAIERLANKGTNAIWPKNDDVIYQKMSYQSYDTTIQNSNIQILFGSGPFPLKQGKRERFSVALVFGTDYEDLSFNKETVQQIYNANYNFAKPPYKATLKAFGGDKKVYLYWDDIAEESRDPFLGYQDNDPRKGYKKDFEGYLIYRSEEPEFNDIKVITDSRGEPKYWKPIAQFDLVDTVKGPDPIGINGAHFWRGNNTGLQHSFIDSNVVNGQTYYYACVAYDMGDPNLGEQGLIPSETTKIISQDLVGRIQFVDINCAVVTPNAPAAGYIPPQISAGTIEGLGTGSFKVQVVDPNEIKEGAVYKILFDSAGTYPLYTTTSYDIIRTLNGVTDTLERDLDTLSMGENVFSPPFDGLVVSVLNNEEVTLNQTGWLVGESNVLMNVFSYVNSRSLPWPSDYEITFSDTPLDTTFFSAPPDYPKFPVNFKVTNLTTGNQSRVMVKDEDGSNSFTIGDTLHILEFVKTPYTISNSRFAWSLTFDLPSIPNLEPDLPAAGDRFTITTHKPFARGDYYSFSTKSSELNQSLAKDRLAKINVVPNPYISANIWEGRNLNQSGRGERRIDFTNLPQKCTIRIYTVTGALVKTLVKESSPTDGSISWNLISEDGMDIAYGLYIYHVDAEGIGEKIGKFAIIK